MKIEIARSFSRKIQVKQYEPIEFFCSAKAEIERPGGTIQDPVMIACAEELDRFVQNEVEKSANKFRQIDTKKSKDIGKEDTEIAIEDLV